MLNQDIFFDQLNELVVFVLCCGFLKFVGVFGFVIVVGGFVVVCVVVLNLDGMFEQVYLMWGNDLMFEVVILWVLFVLVVNLCVCIVVDGELVCIVYGVQCLYIDGLNSEIVFVYYVCVYGLKLDMCYCYEIMVDNDGNVVQLFFVYFLIVLCGWVLFCFMSYGDFVMFNGVWVLLLL